MYQISQYSPTNGIATFSTGNKIIKIAVKYKGVFYK